MIYKIKFPDEVVYIAKILKKHGYTAYAVGGCVRDSIMGRTPSDWDMTTDAHPDVMLEIFKSEGITTIPTGLKHGTVTAVIDKKPYEITTFRIDGTYTDSRRPDSVTFSSDIAEDLRRRDFTVNAMAADPLFDERDAIPSDTAHENCQIIDLYGGLDDIKNKVIRCVGDPFERFSEDALRILRAVRFSSVLGFEIDNDTLDAAEILSYRLGEVSAERKAIELEKTLLSDNADKGIATLMDIRATAFIHKDIHAPTVPLSSLPKSFPARLAALIEGRDKISLAAMKLSNEISHRAALLADRSFYDECSKFFGNNMGANTRYVITKYKNDAEAAAILRSDDQLLTAIKQERERGKLATEIGDLDVNGNALMEAGIAPRALGHILGTLLIEVIKEPSNNKRDVLISRALEIFELEQV